MRYDPGTAVGLRVAAETALTIRQAAVREWQDAGEQDMRRLEAIIEAANSMAWRLELWRRVLEEAEKIKLEA